MKPYKQIYKEFLKLSDLKKHSGASDFTKDWIAIRRKLLGAGNKSSKIKGMRINRKKDYISFIFKSKPTYMSFEKKPSEPAVDSTSLTISKSVKAYTSEIRILDFFALAETKPGFKEKNITWNEIKEILSVANIQIFCDCPSFQFQGMNYISTMFDASIHPEHRPPKRWKKYHHDDNFVCKHLSMIFNSIEFFKSNMTAMINNALWKK